MRGVVTTLDRDVVDDLVRRRSPRSVSVLLDGADRDHGLQRMRPVVARRLRRHGGGGADSLLAQLDELVVQAADRHDGSLALFAADTTAVAVAVPGAVRSRVVVDDTFATRDLVAALDRQVPHLVVLLEPGGIRVLEGCGDRLEPLGRPPARGAGPARRQRIDLREFRRELDAALAAAPARPVILVGPDHLATALQRRSRHHWRIVATGSAPPDAPLAVVARATAPGREVLVERRRAAALDAPERARRQGRLVTGIDEAWACAVDGLGWLAVVEEGFAYPAVVDGRHVAPADDLEAPETVDDLVDELIEAVLVTGGDAAAVPPGTLPDATGVALVRRGR
jgi:hypothetical protein